MEEQKQILPKVAIIYSHPSQTDGKCALILGRVKKILSESGAQVSLADLYADNFNPVMSAPELASYSSRKPPAADVAKYQKLISDNDVLIFIYPVWWSTPPAMLKGFIDRVFTPGFAFNFKDGQMEGLLDGKRALSVRTYSAGAESEQKVVNVSSNFMERAVLSACGIKASAVDLYSMEGVAPSTFEHHLFAISGAVRRQLAPQTGVPHHLRWIPAPYLPPVVGSPKMQQKKEEKKVDFGADAKEQLEWARDSLSQKKRGWVEGEGKRMMSDEQFYDKRKGFRKGKRDFRQTGESGRTKKWESAHNRGLGAGFKGSQEGPRNAGQQGTARPPRGGAYGGSSGRNENDSERQALPIFGSQDGGESRPPQGNRQPQGGMPAHGRGGRGGASQRGNDKNRKHYPGDSHRRQKNYYGRQK